ncbi:ABC transporter permease [Vibrio sp. 10N.286.49.B3]|uniref:ABC transporter permease n=1 Tax=Vibrio sp. 10N.286.49.B3 TaxID=1880855 RepID=UPI000C829F66|nr:FtsX-like permease family protein [Vibrio sp. 10N.286.49.B3]PMH41425.1 ABC transporter permease [Vibrio sp. 10N.286.49.B3]
MTTGLTISKAIPNLRLLRWSVDEIRHGQLWPITMALTLIIACIFAFAALADRMEQVVVTQGKESLTADTVFISSNPLPEELLEQVQQKELVSAQLTRFSTMAFSDTGMQLVSVKAVESHYPLRGELVLSNQTGYTSQVMPGQLWLDERVLALLDISEGDIVTIGDADLTVSGTIVSEPGLSFNPFQQMPTVLINAADIDQTGAIQVGSRVRYQLFLLGETPVLEELQQTIALTASDRWKDQAGSSRANDVFERTTQYLSLTVAIVIIMAAATLVLTCQHYVASRSKTVAMLKSMGASRHWVRRWLVIQVAILFLSAVLLGLFIGSGLEMLLRIPLTELLPDPLPSFGFKPALVAIISSGLIVIPALGIPLIRLLNTSAIHSMQSSHQDNQASHRWWLVIVPILAMGWAYKDNALIWMICAGIVALFLLLAMVCLGLISLFSRLPLSPAMRLAVSRIKRSSQHSGIQVGALSLSLMLLSTIWLVRVDLLSDWQRTLPADAPNAFALNIAPYEKDQYLKQLDDNAITRSEAYPIVRGRLTQINGQDANVSINDKQQTDVLSRELNFTWGEGIPEHNEVLAGKWSNSYGVSVESEVAKDLELSLGDELTFMVNSQQIQAKVNSIRLVEWREMKPNFYFIFSPDVLSSIPATWMVSFRIDGQDSMLNQLSRNFPTVSLMDIRMMGDKIQSLLANIVWAITTLAGLGVVAGLLLIFTLLRLSLSQRQQEIRLYRTLGSSRKRIIQTLWCEYGLIALVAGLVACAGAELSVAAIMSYGFDLAAKFHPILWIILPIMTFITLSAVLMSMIKHLLIPIKNSLG